MPEIFLPEGDAWSSVATVMATLALVLIGCVGRVMRDHCARRVVRIDPMSAPHGDVPYVHRSDNWR